MEFEDEVFGGAEVDFQRLESYGFVKTKKIMYILEVLLIIVS